MTAAVDARPTQTAITALRWAVCFAVVLGLHVGLIVVLLRHVLAPAAQLAAAPATEAIMLDLAPEAVTPVTPAPGSMPTSEAQPPPVLTAEPQPEASVPAPPEPRPSVPAPELAPEPPPRDSVPVLPDPTPPPVAKPAVATPERSLAPARLTPRHPTARPQAVRQPKPDEITAPSPPEPVLPAPTSTLAAPAVLSPSAVPNWRGELLGRLQQAKRYPEAARARNEQGVATAKLTMDRSGHILSVSLVHSSGSVVLDEEAVALITRAEPLPPIPAELVGNTLTLTIPVTFSLR